jgi:hypothetical protein
MTANRKRIGLVLVVFGLLAGCGGTITGSGGPDGATTTVPCSAMGACECLEASDRCAARTEACWCPSECSPLIDCICGGGKFLACENRSVSTACSNELTAVQTKCAGQAFVQFIGGICSSGSDPTCVAGCLAKLNGTGSCSEIDCSFCLSCLCPLPATPSPFAACLKTCAPPLPEGAPR